MVIAILHTYALYDQIIIYPQAYPLVYYPT
jgi:hypothetical protein